VKENKDLGISRDKIQGTYWSKLEKCRVTVVVISFTVGVRGTVVVPDTFEIW